MRKFFGKISVFVLLMALIYVALSTGFYFLESHAKGESERLKYIHDQLKADHLIMGSSRALHHYNPQYLTPYYNIYSCFPRLWLHGQCRGNLRDGRQIAGGKYQKSHT